jgi:hypothetical protein
MAANIQFGGLTSTATTADQVIVSYTPANNISLKCIVIAGFLTTYNATESNMGTVKVQVGGVDKMEFRIQNTDLDAMPGVLVVPLGDGLVFSGSEVVRVIVTPAASTSMRWTGSLIFN